MKTTNMKKADQKGITLLVALLLMGVLLGVSASLLNITLKQYQLSGVSYASEVAFQAAMAGMECALYQDWIHNEFDVPGDGTDQASPVGINCMEENSSSPPAASGEEQLFQFDWEGVCTNVSVYKYHSESSPVNVLVEGVVEKVCPAGSECTVIQSRGYNVECGDIDSGARVVEREYTQVY